MTYQVQMRHDDDLEDVDDPRERRAVIALFDLLQTHLAEYGGGR